MVTKPFFEDKIRVVGTSHISSQSTQDIKKAFLEFKPSIICVELDAGRLQSLLHPEQQRITIQIIRYVGIRGFLFLLIGRYAQKKLGKIVGVNPGTDMLFAVQLAKNNGLRLQLIDKRLDTVVKKLMRSITVKEYVRMVTDVFRALFSRKKQRLHVSLDKVPSGDVLATLMGLLKKRYPSFYRVLVDERNHHMARRIILTHKKNLSENILVVVGAGHKKGIADLLSQYDRRIDSV